jgi:hypothetical protein
MGLLELPRGLWQSVYKFDRNHGEQTEALKSIAASLEKITAHLGIDQEEEEEE